MWPFKNPNKEQRTATASFGDIVATWGPDGWSFSDGQFDYTMQNNDLFNSLVVEKLPCVYNWLADLELEIDKAIEGHVIDLQIPADDREVVSIDVSCLADNNQIDVAYTGNQWADFGVNVVITNGKITESYGAD